MKDIGFPLEMCEKLAERLSNFGLGSNHCYKIAKRFKTYGETGNGNKSYYLHSPADTAEHYARLGYWRGSHRQPGVDPEEFP